MKKEKKKITEDTLLSDVVGEHPETAKVFMEHGLPCATCGMVFFETVGQGAKAHGIDVKKLLKALNDKMLDSST